jgi:RHS repeat-associated protein
MEKDDASGMAHTLWRKYDSLSGRWTTTDPYGGSMTVGDPQSFNRYTYVNNDPVNQVDPSGLMGMSPDASMNWSSVAGSFWGSDLMADSHDTGRAIIAARQAQQENGIKDCMMAKAANKALQDGNGWLALLIVIQGGGGLAFEEQGGADVSDEAEIRGLVQDPFAGVTGGVAGQNPLAGVTGAIAGKIPPTLTYDTVLGSSNSAVWQIKWKLGKPSKTGGWIVQEITETNQNGKPVAHYWEAWPVPAKSRFTIYHGDFSYDDAFVGGPSGHKVAARATFYEGLKLPASFAVGNHPWAGILPSTTANPNLPTFNASSPVNRTWNVP